uniref:Uncharacterized protein n=1 Tax=Oryza barthii TaxID=65489 RepID=A0A0D3G345_9ORYZ
MRGRRRRAREADPVPEPFTIDDEVSHLTRIRSEPSQRTLGAFYAGRKRGISTFGLLSGRESGRSGAGGFSRADCAYAARKHLPTKGPWCVDDMTSEAYVSQFSSDGSLLVAGFRGSRIRIYDADNGWKVHKDISCRSLQWTVSDIALSPDQQLLAYSSLSPTVHIVNVQSAGKESQANVTEIHDGLEFSNDDDDEYSFGIFSVKFSKDGQEIVVGNSDRSINVYDLRANKVSVRIRAHAADVNAVTFADESGNLLYSGSDDNLCKVWDRRCLAREKPAGVLTGHLDGITFIDSRGDGRYFISNCKDQTIKLWDVRKMSASIKGRQPRFFDWDYRWMSFPLEARHCKHPNDQSLATYRGHSVLRTLIRCYFSPVYSTGQRYIYTGSSDEYVYIYDVVTGDIVEKLSWHGSIIRDCTWHPYNPTIVSSSWDGYLARWEASGDEDDLSVLTKNEQRTSPYRQSYTRHLLL